MTQINPNEISWGSYGEYEGPFYRGHRPFRLPSVPNEDDKRLAVIQATEGNCDSINAYDVCIISTGIIQFCEKFFLTSMMLGRVADVCGLDAVIKPLAPALVASNATFRKNASGAWRFHFLDNRGEVNSAKKQQELFLKCDGKKGSWTPEAKKHAKLWAACVASVFQSDETCRAQVEFVKSRLTNFVMPNAKRILFTDVVNTDAALMIQAAYVSFAANNPTKAAAQLALAVKNLKHPKWSIEWCIGVLKQLTHGPGIKIYSARYEAIRPMLEKLYHVELPKLAEDLRTWVEPPITEKKIVKDDVTTPEALTNVEPVNPKEETKSVNEEKLQEVKETSITVSSAPSFLSIVISLLQKLFSTLFRKT